MGKKNKATIQQEEQAKGIRVRYYPRSFLWNVLAVTLAFLFGLFAALAGLFGVGLFYGSTATPKNLFGDNYSSYLKEEYADLSLLDLTKELFAAVNEIATAGGELTLNVLAKFTPILENLLNPMSESLSDMGITLNVNEFLNVPISGMGSFFRESILYPAVLGEALGLKPDSNAVLIALCYGDRGVDYDVVDGEIVMKDGKSPLTLGGLISGEENLIDRVTVEAAFSVTASSNAALRYLAYGTEGTHYKIEDGEIVMLRNAYTGEMFRKKLLMELSADGADNARISDLITLDENSSDLLKTIKDWKVSDLRQQTRINRIKIGQVVTIDGASSRLMQAIADWRIEDLTDQNHIDSLTLGDVLKIGDSSPRLLKSLEDTPIGELGDKINTLRLSDILSQDDIAGNKILHNLGMSTLDSLANDIQHLSVAQVFGDSLYSYMEIKSEEGKQVTYLDMLKAYDNGKNGNDEEGKTKVPEPIPYGAEIKASYSYDGKTLSAGWFCLEDALYRLVEDAEVYKTTVTEGDQKLDNYFAERKIHVQATYEYRLLDYATGELTPISCGTVTEGYADGSIDTAEGEPILQNGLPLYYYTERVKPSGSLDEQEPSEEELPQAASSDTEPVRYPLLRDSYGVFCLYLSEEGLIERLDFEEIAVSYTSDEGAVEPITDEAGKTVYDKVRYENAEVRLYHAENYDYILVRDSVEQRYYNLKNVSETYSFDTEGVTVLYTASWTDTEGGQSHTDVPVDRFLHGFWYLLFGGETVDEDGNITGVVDNSNFAIVDIDDSVSEAREELNEYPLWKLYFHGIITANPYLPISGGTNGADNLNQLTISEAIKFFKTALGGSSAG